MLVVYPFGPGSRSNKLGVAVNSGISSCRRRWRFSPDWHLTPLAPNDGGWSPGTWPLSSPPAHRGRGRRPAPGRAGTGRDQICSAAPRASPRPANVTGGGGLTAPAVGDRDRRHAAQRIAAIGGAGGHDFRAGWRDDGRDPLSVPSPPPAGRRGSREPESDGHVVAWLDQPPHNRLLQPPNVRPPRPGGQAPTFGVTGLAARPRSPLSGTTPHRPAAVAMAAAPSAPASRVQPPTLVGLESEFTRTRPGQSPERVKQRLYGR